MIPQYMIDTDTFIYIKNHRPPQVLARFSRMDVGVTGISVITYGELFRGAERSEHCKQNHRVLQQLIKYIPVQPMPEDTGLFYGQIRTALEKRGQVIGANDLWIAAHALAMNLTLVTNNTQEFKRIKRLKIENWI